jgi:hypothetical protein
MNNIIALLFVVMGTALGVSAVTPKIQSWWYHYKNSGTVDTARHIYMELKPHYLPRGGFGSAAITAETVDGYQAAPKKYVRGSGSSTTINNDFDGVWTITGSGQRLFLDTDQVPQVNCRQLMVNLSTDDGFSGISVASTTSGLTSATVRTPPVDDATAKTDCANTLNAMRFTAGP